VAAGHFSGWRVIRQLKARRFAGGAFALNESTDVIRLCYQLQRRYIIFQSETPVKGVIMFFQGKRKAADLRVFAAALSLCFVANAGTVAAGRSPVLMRAGMPLAANPESDSACQAVLDASDKLFTTPYHMYSTQAGAVVGNGKPMSSELVFSGGLQYILYNGKWSPSPLSTEELKALHERNRNNAKNMSCHYVRDESVNGESAALYSTHEETAHGKNDNQIWVSKSKGLILRQETDIDTGGANGKTHISSRYQYANVQAPKL